MLDDNSWINSLMLSIRLNNIIAGYKTNWTITEQNVKCKLNFPKKQYSVYPKPKDYPVKWL